MGLILFLIIYLWVILGAILEARRRVTDKDKRFEPGTPFKFFIMTLIEGPMVWIGYLLLPTLAWVYCKIEMYVKFVIAWMEAPSTKGQYWHYTPDSKKWYLVEQETVLFEIVDEGGVAQTKKDITVPFMTWDQQKELLANCGVGILLLEIFVCGMISAFAKMVFKTDLLLNIWWFCSKWSLVGLFGLSVFFIIYHYFGCSQSKIGLHSYIKVKSVMNEDPDSLIGKKYAHVYVCKKCGNILDEVERLNITLEKINREKDIALKKAQEKKRVKKMEKERVTKIAKEAGVI